MMRLRDQICRLALVVVTVIAPRASASVPSAIGIDGTLRSASGGPVADGNYTVTFALYPSAAATQETWSEAGQIKVVAGRFRWSLGSVTPLPTTKLTAAKSSWLGARVGTDPELPRVPLRSVAFARRAGHADSAATAETAKSAQSAKTALSADSAKSAQTAQTAGHAKTADHAKVADSAKVATTAKQADTAKQAAQAAALLCTGCVGVAHLKFDADVDLGSRALKANKISTNQLLATELVAGSVAGNGSKLTHLRITGGACSKGDYVTAVKNDGSVVCSAPPATVQHAVLTKPPATCGKQQAGQVYFDATSKRLRVCDGEAWTAVGLYCGDGNVTGSEQCDDGNTIGGDGCAADCTVEEPAKGLMLKIDAAANATAASLDPTKDIPNVMSATHGTFAGTKAWSFNGSNQMIRWDRDGRWHASGDYTLVMFTYHRQNSRDGILSQYTHNCIGGAKFNWMQDPNGGWHNNPGGTWQNKKYALNTWHMHAVVNDKSGLVHGRQRIYVDGHTTHQVDIPATSVANRSCSVAVGARDDGYAPEFFYGYISVAWYFNRPLSTTELRKLYDQHKKRHGINRPFVQ